MAVTVSGRWLPPCAEHFLDWFHITMRLTVLGQFAKGVVHQDAAAGADITERLERIKWRLWHGDAIEAQERLADLADDLRALDVADDGLTKFARLTAECARYIANNIDAIPHYEERWRSSPPTAGWRRSPIRWSGSVDPLDLFSTFWLKARAPADRIATTETLAAADGLAVIPGCGGP